MIRADLGITVISGKSSLMRGMSQPGTVGKSSLREILSVCVCLLGRVAAKKRGSLLFLDSRKELSPLVYFPRLPKEQINGSLGKVPGLVFVLFLSLKGGPADENKL